MRGALGLAIAVGVLLGCGPPDAPGETAEGGLLFWRIDDPAQPGASVDVLATVALSENDRLAFDEAVVDSFEAANRLLLPNSAALSKQNALIGWKGHLEEGDRLSNWLSPEVFADYVEAVGKAGFPPTFADVTAPWLASRMVGLADRKRLGFVAERELEVYFAHLARERAAPKEIVPFEESAESYDRHVALSREVQAQIMQRALLDSARAEEALPAAARAWRRGDAAGLDEILRATDAAHPELSESRALTIAHESERLADAVAGVLAGEPAHRDFLIADARSLLGADGMLERLRERGLTVSRIPPRGVEGSPYPAPPLPEVAAETAGGRVLVVGIDGATLRLIEPLIEAGRLPTLAALARDGASGPLRAHRPIYSPRIWNSIATGKTPESHGVEGFTFEDEEGTQRLYLAIHRKAHALWNIVSTAGKRVAVVNWWNTYPPEVVNGVMISDHAKPTRLDELRNLTGADAEEDAGATVYPPAWRERAVRTYAERPAIPGQRDPFLGNLGLADWMSKEELSKRFRDDGSTARIALEVLAELRPEVAMVFLPGIDRVSHRLWAAVEPADAYAKPPPMSERQREAARQALHDYYAYSDALVGLLTAAYGPDDLVIVLSDHGFEAGEHLGDLTGVHESEAAVDGIVFARGPGIAPGSDSGTPSVNDVTPTILAWLGLPLGEDMDGEVAAFVTPKAPVRKIATHDTSEIERLEIAPSGSEEEILDQLRALGYIE